MELFNEFKTWIENFKYFHLKRKYFFSSKKEVIKCRKNYKVEEDKIIDLIFNKNFLSEEDMRQIIKSIQLLSDTHKLRFDSMICRRINEEKMKFTFKEKGCVFVDYTLFDKLQLLSKYYKENYILKDNRIINKKYKTDSKTYYKSISKDYYKSLEWMHTLVLFEINNTQDTILSNYILPELKNMKCNSLYLDETRTYNEKVVSKKRKNLDYEYNTWKNFINNKSVEELSYAFPNSYKVDISYDYIDNCLDDSDESYLNKIYIKNKIDKIDEQIKNLYVYKEKLKFDNDNYIKLCKDMLELTKLNLIKEKEQEIFNIKTKHFDAFLAQNKRNLYFSDKDIVSPSISKEDLNKFSFALKSCDNLNEFLNKYKKMVLKKQSIKQKLDEYLYDLDRLIKEKEQEIFELKKSLGFTQDIKQYQINLIYSEIEKSKQERINI